MPRHKLNAFSLALLLLTSSHAAARAAPSVAVQKSSSRPARAAADVARDRELAARFAPTFYQGLGERKRSDYLTNFNFDGDWRGDNNWANANDARFRLRAYVYYAVSETPTHYFLHYAVFHPQDYKGGGLRGPLLSEAIREGVRRGGKYDPTGLSGSAVLAHENDMEGCLVVVAKNGNDLDRAEVIYVETVSHDRFLKYAVASDSRNDSARVRVEGQRALLYVEPKGHGIEAFSGGEKQTPEGGVIVYRFTGRADDPEGRGEGSVGYELLSLHTELWPRAQKKAPNETFGAALKLKTLTVRAAQKSGKVGSRGWFWGRRETLSAAASARRIAHARRGDGSTVKRVGNRRASGSSTPPRPSSATSNRAKGSRSSTCRPPSSASSAAEAPTPFRTPGDTSLRPASLRSLPRAAPST